MGDLADVDSGPVATRQRITEELHQVVWNRAINLISDQLQRVPVGEADETVRYEMSVWVEQVEIMEFQSRLAEELRRYVWQRCASMVKSDGLDSKNGVSEEVGPHQPPPNS